MIRSNPAVRRAGATLLTGIALGTIILGVGGRIAMRAIAVKGGTPGMLTPSGTLTVILAGTASGLAGAVFQLVAGAITGRLAPRHLWVRRVLFGILLVLVTLRGLSPVQPLALALFGPLVLLYAIAMEVAASRRAAVARDTPATTVVAT